MFSRRDITKCQDPMEWDQGGWAYQASIQASPAGICPLLPVFCCACQLLLAARLPRDDVVHTIGPLED